MAHDAEPLPLGFGPPEAPRGRAYGSYAHEGSQVEIRTEDDLRLFVRRRRDAKRTPAQAAAARSAIEDAGRYARYREGLRP